MKIMNGSMRWFPTAFLVMLLAAVGCSSSDSGDDAICEGCILGDFSAYHGMFHSHTSFSDGIGMPREAYVHARDEGDLDVFALTDHLEQLYLPPPVDKWQRLHAAADEFYVPGSYVTLVGYEYGSGFELPWFISTGHANVFFIDYLLPIVTLDYHIFYEQLLDCPDCLAQMNHPGREIKPEWDGFAYVPEVDPKINQIELSPGYPEGWNSLFMALDQGWHLSPTWNQDNHTCNWGTADDHRTGLWLDELTREAVRRCFHDRRTFSTLDKNAYVKLATSEGCWMGSILENCASATLVIEAFDPDDGDGFETIELWGPGQERLREIPCDGLTWCVWEIDWTVEEAGYVLMNAIQADGDLLVSAPIWFNP